MSSKETWHIHLDREDDDYIDNRFSLTLNKNEPGWNTDSGYVGYGLPKDLAQWICDTLNKSPHECPYKMDEYGMWSKK